MDKLLTCIIVDCDNQNSTITSRLIEKFIFGLDVVGVASSIEEASKFINNQKPDIVFLEIEMGNSSGFDLLKEFNEPRFEIIFTSFRTEFAIKAIKYNAIDYLLKPLDMTELRLVVEKARTKIGSKYIYQKDLSVKLDYLRKKFESSYVEFEKIPLQYNDVVEMVNLIDIIWCCADQHQTYFHLLDGRKLIIQEKLKIYNELLPDDSFNRIHKSHIVNLFHILKFYPSAKKQAYVELIDGTVLTVAHRRKADFKKWLKLSTENQIKMINSQDN